MSQDQSSATLVIVNTGHDSVYRRVSEQTAINAVRPAVVAGEGVIASTGPIHMHTECRGDGEGIITIKSAENTVAIGVACWSRVRSKENWEALAKTFSDFKDALTKLPVAPWIALLQLPPFLVLPQDVQLFICRASAAALLVVAEIDPA